MNTLEGQKYWRDGAVIVEAALKRAERADPRDAPIPYVGEEALIWHAATASAYMHALEMMGPPSTLAKPGDENAPENAPFLVFERDHRSNKGLHELYVRGAYDDLKTIRACVNKLQSRSRWPATIIAHELWQHAQSMIRAEAAWHDAAALLFARLPAPPERETGGRATCTTDSINPQNPADAMGMPLPDLIDEAAGEAPERDRRPQFVRRVGENIQRVGPAASDELPDVPA